MKIKCPQCLLENLKGSKFCQECGFELSPENLKKVKTGIAASLHEEIEKIDDVIFRPKKREMFSKKPIERFVFIACVGTILGFIGIMVLASLSSEESQTTNIKTESATFPISYLNIVDSDLIYDDYFESYFTGTIKNFYSRAARNVSVRLDFYYDKDLKRHFDTRIVTIWNGAEENGAFSFQVPINFYPRDHQSWWTWKIESADYGL